MLRNWPLSCWPGSRAEPSPAIGKPVTNISGSRSSGKSSPSISAAMQATLTPAATKCTCGAMRDLHTSSRSQSMSGSSSSRCPWRTRKPGSSSPFWTMAAHTARKTAGRVCANDGSGSRTFSAVLTWLRGSLSTRTCRPSFRLEPAAVNAPQLPSSLSRAGREYTFWTARQERTRATAALNSGGTSSRPRKAMVRPTLPPLAAARANSTHIIRKDGLLLQEKSALHLTYRAVAGFGLRVCSAPDLQSCRLRSAN